jgi:hypothetical protein
MPGTRQHVAGHDELGRAFNFPFIKWKHPCASVLPGEMGREL